MNWLSSVRYPPLGAAAAFPTIVSLVVQNRPISTSCLVAVAAGSGHSSRASRHPAAYRWAASLRVCLRLLVSDRLFRPT
jgi:hypothetical protein